MANEEGKPIRQGPDSQPNDGQQPVITGQATLKKWSQLLKQVWADEQLKQRLLDKPAAVLQEHGIEVPAGMEVRVVENTDKVSYVTLPPACRGCDGTDLKPTREHRWWVAAASYRPA